MLKPDDDEDPRSRLDVNSDDDDDDEAIYGGLEEADVAPSVPPKSPYDTSREDHSPGIDLSRFDVDDSAWEHGKLKADSLILPRPTAANDDKSASSSSPSSSSQTQSKTAALIEMYRERERALPAKPAAPVPAASTTTVYIPAAIQPSRLPVRALPPPPREVSPPAPTPSTSTIPSPSPPPPPPQEIVPPPRVVLEDSGRGSPMRYVHGAPLHNVLEEEEEL